MQIMCCPWLLFWGDSKHMKIGWWESQQQVAWSLSLFVLLIPQLCRTHTVTAFQTEAAHKNRTVKANVCPAGPAANSKHTQKGEQAREVKANKWSGKTTRFINQLTCQRHACLTEKDDRWFEFHSVHADQMGRPYLIKVKNGNRVCTHLCCVLLFWPANPQLTKLQMCSRNPLWSLGLWSSSESLLGLTRAQYWMSSASSLCDDLHFSFGQSHSCSFCLDPNVLCISRCIQTWMYFWEPCVYHSFPLSVYLPITVFLCLLFFFPLLSVSLIHLAEHQGL